MRPTESRPISISDLMILIPAVALGALVLRCYLPGHALELKYLSQVSSGPSGLVRLYSWAYGPGSCFAAPLMAAMIVVRLRPPRPPRPRVIGQPGFVACLAVMASLVPGVVWVATIHHRPGFEGARGFEQFWLIATRWADSAVIGSWVALALTRRWRPEPSWIDRLGISLGLFWVLRSFSSCALEWFPKLQLLLSLAGGMR